MLNFVGPLVPRERHIWWISMASEKTDTWTTKCGLILIEQQSTEVLGIEQTNVFIRTPTSNMGVQPAKIGIKTINWYGFIPGCAFN